PTRQAEKDLTAFLNPPFHDAALSQEAVAGWTGAYELRPMALAGVRRELFAMLSGRPSEAALAPACLTAIGGPLVGGTTPPRITGRTPVRERFHGPELSSPSRWSQSSSPRSRSISSCIEARRICMALMCRRVCSN